MNYTYYLYKVGEGYRTEQGSHVDAPRDAMGFDTYQKANDYIFEHDLTGYQIVELF